MKVKSLNGVQLFEILWTVAYQAHSSMGFSRQEHWSGWSVPSPGDLPNPGIKQGSLALQADALPFEPPGKSWCTQSLVQSLNWVVCCVIISFRLKGKKKTFSVTKMKECRERKKRCFSFLPRWEFQTPFSFSGTLDLSACLGIDSLIFQSHLG